MSSNGECFVVLTPHTLGGTVIFGRNSENTELVENEIPVEVHFYESTAAIEGKADGGAEPEISDEALRIILQKPRPGVWGADFGANDCNVTIGLSWVSQETEHDSKQLSATDIVRYTLSTAKSAENAVDRIGDLVSKFSSESVKMNFIVCDPKEVWNISCAQKLWAAERITTGFRYFSSKGLSVSTTIDKSSTDLSDSLKTIGLWNGEGELNFANIFDASYGEDITWIGDQPTENESYTLTSMFDTLRSAVNTKSSRSATVSVLNNNGISCNWLTATPNAKESVFKPFVFAPNPRISPLTKVPTGNAITLLHKLHAQRKPSAVDDLKALETRCVDEVSKYFAEHPIADDELDELMKDCVEAEVKFYR